MVWRRILQRRRAAAAEWIGNEGVLRGGAPGSAGNPDLFLDL